MAHRILSRLRWWGDRWLLLLGCTFLFLALILAAIDQVPTMISVVYIAVVFFAIHGIVAAYCHLPIEERHSSFSRRFLRRAAVASVIGGSLLASLYWFLGWAPIGSLPDIAVRHFAKLDYIPSAFALLLPIEWRSGFHQYFRYSTYCFPGAFWWESLRYLRTAILAYTATLFLFICGVRLFGATVRGWRV